MSLGADGPSGAEQAGDGAAGRDGGDIAGHDRASAAGRDGADIAGRDGGDIAGHDRASAAGRDGADRARRTKTAAVLLAAGEGKRHTGAQHKLLRPLEGRPLVSWAVESVCQANFDEVYVVVGAVPLESLLPDTVTIVENHQWQQGQGTSLLASVRVAEHDGYGAVVVGLADMPFVTPQTWQAVAAEPGSIVTATYGSKRRPPVKLEAEVWPLLPLFETDEGARNLMRRRPELVREVACADRPDDFDTEADFRRKRY